MKKIAIMVFAIFVGTLASCNKEDEPTGGTPDTNPSVSLLTDQEKTDLLFLREEEKLARDVYLYAFDKYNFEVFQQIAGSEQVHMDEVKVLLDKYELEDPASVDKGVFNDAILQNLYNQLIAMTDTSLVGGLTAGMIIEDMDMADIGNFEANTTITDILDVHEFLKCTSRNHMRYFYMDLTKNGGTYSPQYISQTDYDEIVNSQLFMCR
jgi:hypothetical protein